MGLLKRAKSPIGKKQSRRFIGSSVNEWCRGLICVVKNDCGHVEHCNLAGITVFHKTAYGPLTSINQIFSVDISSFYEAMRLPCMYHKFLVLAVQKWLKSVYIYESYRKIKIGVPLF